MRSFVFLMCLIVAGFLSRVNFFLIFPPLIVAYLIARFTDFTRVSDRTCMALVACALFGVAVLAFIRQQL